MLPPMEEKKTPKVKIKTKASWKEIKIQQAMLARMMLKKLRLRLKEKYNKKMDLRILENGRAI